MVAERLGDHLEDCAAEAYASVVAMSKYLA